MTDFERLINFIVKMEEGWEMKIAPCSHEIRITILDGSGESQIGLVSATQHTIDECARKILTQFKEALEEPELISGAIAY